jgi:hypothetical protein
MTRTLCIFFAVHGLLALAPLGMLLLRLNISSLPIVWLLSTTPLSQIMLLSIWVGLTPGGHVRKIAACVSAICWFAAERTIVEYVMSTDGISLAGSFLRDFASHFSLLSVFCLVMIGARRKLGMIGRFADVQWRGPTSFQYSLFALLTLASVTALLLGLMRASRLDDDRGSTGVIAAVYVLVFGSFAINTLAAVWAVLAFGKPSRRIIAVLFISLVLGVSIALAMSHDELRWWLFAGSSMVSVWPTTIVVFSLLFFRRRGFRLARSESEAYGPVAADVDEFTGG